MKLVISGTTGVGKSTTVNLLKKRLEGIGKKVTVVGELVAGSPYFDLYFDNLSEWGFIAQMDFLMERFRQYLQIEKIAKENPNEVFIFDRHFLEDKIFSDLHWVKQNVSAFQSNIYKTVWDDLLKKAQSFEEIDFFILLKAEFDLVEERMNKRGRLQEEKFDTKYWKDLYWKYYSSSSYRKVFRDHSKDFLELSSDDKKPDEVVDAIIRYLARRTKVIPTKYKD